MSCLHKKINKSCETHGRRLCFHCWTIKDVNQFYKRNDNELKRRCKKCESKVIKKYKNMYTKAHTEQFYAETKNKKSFCKLCIKFKKNSEFYIKRNDPSGYSHVCIKHENKKRSEYRRSNISKMNKSYNPGKYDHVLENKYSSEYALLQT